MVLPERVAEMVLPERLPLVTERVVELDSRVPPVPHRDGRVHMHLALVALATIRIHQSAFINQNSPMGVDTSSTAMGARTTSFLKDLEHRNACVDQRAII